MINKFSNRYILSNYDINEISRINMEYIGMYKDKPEKVRINEASMPLAISSFSLLLTLFLFSKLTIPVVAIYSLPALFCCIGGMLCMKKDVNDVDKLNTVNISLFTSLVSFIISTYLLIQVEFLSEVRMVEAMKDYTFLIVASIIIVSAISYFLFPKYLKSKYFKVQGWGGKDIVILCTVLVLILLVNSMFTFIALSVLVYFFLIMYSVFFIRERSIVREIMKGC